MHRRTARANRVALALVGLILLAGGGYAIARTQGVFGSSASSLYTRPQARWIHAHDKVWIAVAAVVIVIGLLAVRWLYIQPRLDTVRRIVVDPDEAGGRTRLAAGVIGDAIEDDVEGYHGVLRARAFVTGAASAPQLVLRITARSGADLSAIREQVLDEALPAARLALEDDELPVFLHFQIASRQAERLVR